MADLALVVTTDADNPVEGDLMLVNGDFVLVRGLDAIEQHLRVRLRFFLGEWFLDEREGVPFFRDIFVKNPNVSLITAELRRVVTSTPGVSSCEQLTVDIDAGARRATVTIRATTDTGESLVFDAFDLLGGTT